MTEIERAIVGSLLIDCKAIDEIPTVTADMFADPILGRMFLEFQRGYDNGYAVDPAILAHNIDDIESNIVQTVIMECLQEVYTSANIKSYGNALVESYKARKADEIMSMIKLSPKDVDGQIGAIIEALDALRESRVTTCKSLAEICMEEQSNYFCEKLTERLTFGFEKLDAMLYSLEAGDVTIIGARPAVGKSAFVTQISRNLAKEGKRVGFYNMEMSNKQLYERFLAMESGLQLSRIKLATRYLNDEREIIEKANKSIQDMPNLIISTGSKTVSQIKSECKNMMYDVVIIDYLQLIKPDKSYKGNRFAEVGEISRAIKAMAMELQIPVIVLSQLHRLQDNFTEPTKSDLRESGDIEQDASIIVLMWNIDDNGKKGLKVDKNRQGECGKIVMDFDGGKMTFTETNENVSTAMKQSRLRQECGENPFE